MKLQSRNIILNGGGSRVRCQSGRDYSLLFFELFCSFQIWQSKLAISSWLRKLKMIAILMYIHRYSNQKKFLISLCFFILLLDLCKSYLHCSLFRIFFVNPNGQQLKILHRVINCFQKIIWLRFVSFLVAYLISLKIQVSMAFYLTCPYWKLKNCPNNPCLFSSLYFAC